MNDFAFSAARAVFTSSPVPNQVSVSQYGFYCALDLSSTENETFPERAIIRLAARNVYRLYVNGELTMHGPARTAHGYCRVDELDITDRLIGGMNHIAVEIVVYGRDWEGYRHYSNDCTLEDGLFIAEIDADGTVLAATGRDNWQVCRINARAPFCERISHSRECIEIYTPDDDFYLWKLGRADFTPTHLLKEEPVYLRHRALLPTLAEYPFEEITGFGAVYIDPDAVVDPFFFEGEGTVFESLPERPTLECRRTRPYDSGVLSVDHSDSGIELTPKNADSYALSFDGGESRVGFLRIAITAQHAGIIDIVRSEMILPNGQIPHFFNNVTRLHVPAGLTEFITMEPALARYVTLYFRGTGAATLHTLSIIDDSYPDEKLASFLCSDDNINRLYKAAKKTLLLNTLDIFMDCPERERGGWLCDSLWTGRAASLMLSDNLVEREHIENFLLTNANEMSHAFFPEVYPAFKESFSSFTGLTTWSFWLMCELCEFIRRTGDVSFRDEHKPRVTAFVNGTKDYMGACGLLENMPAIFVDWSLANNEEYTQPISTAANALYAYMMTELGETYEEPAWVKEGKRVRELLRSAVVGKENLATMVKIPDSLTWSKEEGFRSRNKYSEAAMCTSLWCGLFNKDEAPELYLAVRDCMGPAPVFAKNPMVGISQLFIGLCIRMDMLCRNGYYDKMFEDMLAIFMPQLKEGPGTLWENEAIDTSSRCHGFTAHAGVHLMRDVLGLGIPLYEKNGEGKPTLDIAPHICGLRWAKGTHSTQKGLVSVDWRYDGENFSIRVIAPSAYECRLTLPREARMLDDSKVTVVTKYY